VTNGEIIRKTLCLIEGTVVQVVIHHLRVILHITEFLRIIAS